MLFYGKKMRYVKCHNFNLVVKIHTAVRGYMQYNWKKPNYNLWRVAHMQAWTSSFRKANNELNKRDGLFIKNSGQVKHRNILGRSTFYFQRLKNHIFSPPFLKEENITL